MAENDKPVVIYSTWPDASVAAAAGGALVEAGLAACANILPAMTSIYVWRGQLQRDGEVAMLLKTRASLAERVVAAIQSRHPYDTPAILVLPVAGGSDAFTAWIMAGTAAPAP